jgi:hypothetical protein
MICYICDREVHPGGTRYGILPAIGVCHDCGIGVCARHGNKEAVSGAPLLCPDCALLRRVPGKAVWAEAAASAERLQTVQN